MRSIRPTGAAREHTSRHSKWPSYILRLKQAAGILNEDDLTEVNGWLE